MSEANTKVEVSEDNKADWEYVTIPETDLYDEPHPSIWNNRREFAPGTHHLSPEMAADLKDRLKVFAASQRRILRGTPDRLTLKQIADRDARGR